MGRIITIDGIAVQRYRENPFLPALAETTTTGWKPRYMSPDGGVAVLLDGGEVKGAAIIYKEEVDKSNFIKIYADGIAPILNLHNAGKRAFMVVYEQLLGRNGIGRTMVNLDWQMLPDVEQAAIGSKKSLMRGIKELIVAKIIAPTMTPGVYFINPVFVFNGNRLTVARQFIQREAASIPDPIAKMEAAGQQILIDAPETEEVGK